MINDTCSTTTENGMTVVSGHGLFLTSWLVSSLAEECRKNGGNVQYVDIELNPEEAKEKFKDYLGLMGE
jgi:hypothetical protein